MVVSPVITRYGPSRFLVTNKFFGSSYDLTLGPFDVKLDKVHPRNLLLFHKPI